jgi:hypothetical protein
MRNSISRKLIGGLGMSWNYRVVRFDNEDVGEYFEIKEVFYDKSGELAGYSEASVFSDTYEGLFEVMDLMKAATAKPVIDESEFFSKKEKA